MTDLALDSELGGTIRLYDIDHSAAENNAIIGNALSARPEAPGKWEYVTSPSLAEALTGADFIVISILPGTFDEMESDVHLPERLGIYQSVGDTSGPGGIIRGLRTVPMFVDIAKAVETYAPEAWVINYTNPMALCVKALYETFPKIKAFGCCHEVFGTQEVLMGIAEEVCGFGDISRSDIHVNVLGVNHFTWFDYASCRNIDLFPVYHAYADKHMTDGYTKGDENWSNSHFGCANIVKFDLFREYGLIAAAGDRHLAEFMPGGRYLKDPGTVTSWKFSLTPVRWRKADLERRLQRSRDLVSGREQMELKSSGEEGIDLIKALCGLKRVISNVNIPNTCGQISNLPLAAVVETNAMFERDAISPVAAGALPENVLSLVLPHAENQEIVFKAVISCDMDLTVRAFLNDPLVEGRAAEEEVRLLVRDMARNTMGYLPEAWRGYF